MLFGDGEVANDGFMVAFLETGSDTNESRKAETKQ